MVIFSLFFLVIGIAAALGALATSGIVAVSLAMYALLVIPSSIAATILTFKR